ncbi:MAG: DEAD/DEAH box helicase family protein, partial [Lachnospiraceae bacterium]|nr:DEAD/DEAH box helicase family protein [Lachnospiraceae bacterium]
IEWNYRFSSLKDQRNFNLFYDTFENLFFHHSIVVNEEELRRYSKNWHRPAVLKDLARYDKYKEGSDEYEEDFTQYGRDRKVEPLFQPRGAQIEALYALEDSRAEGAVKGLVQAATGIGKTYLAAFDSAGYERVLFVAHREEILKQAAISFQNVRRSEDYGFFYGRQKDTDKSVIFASAATLGRKEYLREEYFPEDYFDYVVIDEFHHAVNDQYRRIVNYFKPQFMLGLTATPERMDGRNIYEICDYNVPYEISLKEAINKGMLVPFHYYGIYDETDYSKLRLVKGRYDAKELTEIYRNNGRRYDLIYKYYRKYRSKRALGFCCSRQHAREMAEEFCKRGVPAKAVYSNSEGEYSEDRDKAVQQLKNQEIQVVFSVDMFNEGVDIASLDMVMFLRPTESPIVFLQQLGRGLRLFKGKEYLNVLDFIGNYEKAGRAPLLLGGGENYSQKKVWDYSQAVYPDDCIVDFDMRLIDLFQELNKKSCTVKERIQREYYRVKELLEGRVPSRMELFTYMEDTVYEDCIKHPKENPFRRYLDFLQEMHELSEEEEIFCKSLGRDFLSVIETTDMQKVYKMPVLYSFYNHGRIRLAVTEEEVLAGWKEFFDTGTNWKDFSPDISYEAYKNMTDRQHLRKAETMPIKFLKSSGKGFFVEKEGYAIAIREELRDSVESEVMRTHMKDILEYRTMEYYRRRYQKKEK